MKVQLTCLIALALAATTFAAESPSAFVFVNPDTSSFWRTARSSSVTVPVDFPDGATSATLSVTGVGCSARYDIASEGPCSFSLPAAANSGGENTYSLTLSFDRGEPKTAQVSLIAGQESGGAGATRCVSQESRVWSRVAGGHFTLPIPYGTTSLTLNGETVNTGLDGAQGFITLSTLPAALRLAADGTTYNADLDRLTAFMMILR